MFSPDIPLQHRSGLLSYTSAIFPAYLSAGVPPYKLRIYIFLDSGCPRAFSGSRHSGIVHCRSVCFGSRSRNVRRESLLLAFFCFFLNTPCRIPYDIAVLILFCDQFLQFQCSSIFNLLIFYFFGYFITIRMFF